MTSKSVHHFGTTAVAIRVTTKEFRSTITCYFFYFYPKRPAFYRLFGAFLYIYYLIIFCVGRIGGMLAPWIGQLSTVHHYLPVSVFGICTILGRSKAILFSCSIPIIEEELIQKRRQRSSLMLGDRVNSIPCCKLFCSRTI